VRAESAAREEIISRNVARLVQVPAPRYKINRGLTVEQAKATLRAARGHRMEAQYVLALFLGLRRGELLGLRWVDVDLDTEKLEVVQTFSGSAVRCASYRPRPRTQPARFRFRQSASRPCASTGNGSSPSGPTCGPTGRTTAWSSHAGAALP
jgi:integrase